MAKEGLSEDQVSDEQIAATHELALSKARAATDKEHKMTLWQGVRSYPKAIGWSLAISMCVVMEAFDSCLLNNFYALPQFQAKFGSLQPDGKVAITAAWQAGLSNGTSCGQIIGLILNGIITERFGYRYTVLVCLTLIAAWVSIYFTATHITHLLVAAILSGIEFGFFQTLVINYAAEVCPVALRGYLTTWVNACWGIGQLVGVGSVRGSEHWKGDKAFRVPYALQWMWPLPLAIVVFLAPESPWWLVRRGRVADAKVALRRLTSSEHQTDEELDETIAMIAHTTTLEQQITEGATYLDCFRGTNLRRTEIVCMTWATQNLSGNSFAGYAAYFLEQAGVPTTDAIDFTLGKSAINFLGVFGAWILISYGFGRRTLYIYGLAGLFCLLMILGFLGLAPGKTSVSFATGAIMILWACCYQLTVGTVCYSLVGEIPSRKLQIKTVAVGRAVYICVAIVCSVLTPYMLNPTEWNWKQFAGFFWAGTTLISLVYAYYRIPEPAGRTYAELDVLFERKVSARKFSTERVDALDERVEGGAIEKFEHKLETGELEQC